MENVCSIRCSARRWLRDASEHDLARVLRVIAGPDFADGSQIAHFIFLRIHATPLAAGPLADLGWEFLRLTNPPTLPLLSFTPTISRHGSRRSTTNAPLPCSVPQSR